MQAMWVKHISIPQTQSQIFRCLILLGSKHRKLTMLVSHDKALGRKEIERKFMAMMELKGRGLLFVETEKICTKEYILQGKTN